MGVIDEAKEKERAKPDFPNELLEVYLHFKQLRFGKNIAADKITLIPRKQLQYREIEAYKAATGAQLNTNEVEIIMNIDAIFEMREVNNG